MRLDNRVSTTTIIVNPIDFQVSKEFPANKESTWPYPAAEEGWVKAHDALQMEIVALREALAAMQMRGPVQKEREIVALQKATTAHLVHIHAHHSNEDNIMAPFLRKRFHYPKKLTTDHDNIVKQLTLIEGLIKNLKANDSVDLLLQEFVKYETDLLPHLQEEEDIVLPLLRAFFDPQEIQPAIHEIIKHSPKLETGSLVESIGVEAFRKTFMVREGIPFFVWHIDIYWKRRAFLHQFTYNIQAIKSGEERKKRRRTLL